MNLTYHMPVKVIAGRDCIRENAALMCSLGGKALIVTGKNSAKRCGALDDVIGALTQEGRGYAVFDEVMANPTIECVYDGAAMARREGVDFIVAIGGGSPMDAAKVIALLACADVPRETLFSGQYGSRALPMALVPTTAGTGSEVTPYAVLTNHEAKTKKSVSSPMIFPKFAFLDASYMMSLPMKSTINTAIDALSHAVEGMLTVRANPMSDLFAGQSIRDIIACFGALQRGSLTFEERETLLYASMLAGVVIAQTGTTVVHPMGYPLTYYKGLDHGRANGLLLGVFLEFVRQRAPERVQKVLGCAGISTVGELDAMLGSLLKEKERLTPQEIEQYAQVAAKTKNVANSCVAPTYEEIVQMYRQSLGAK